MAEVAYKPDDPRPLVFGEILICGEHLLSESYCHVFVTLFNPETKTESVKVRIPLQGCEFNLGKRYHVTIREELDNVDE